MPIYWSLTLITSARYGAHLWTIAWCKIKTIPEMSLTSSVETPKQGARF